MKPREPRVKVVIHARMRMDGAWGDACIRNISSRGMFLQAATPPARGSYVEIFRGKHIIIGRVVWQKDRGFGIRTQDKLPISAIIEEPVQGTKGNVRGASPPIERRADPSRATAATVSERLERSRRFSMAFQSAIIIVAGIAGAAVLMGTVQQILARPLTDISSHLGN
jgi:hypothetical protein